MKAFITYVENSDKRINHGAIDSGLLRVAAVLEHSSIAGSQPATMHGDVSIDEGSS